MKRTGGPLLLAAVAAAAAGAAGYAYVSRSAKDVPPVRAAVTRATSAHPLPHATTLDRAHYRIASTATPEQTARVADAAERLHHAYRAFFADALPANPAPQRLSLVLYRDQQEFKAHNRSKPWAEAYYLAPSCHAYYAQGQRNPVHWMLHEATHQLSREVARFPKVRWVDEGLASYFGASRIEQGQLRLGQPDADAYPLWWLPHMALSGDLQQDLQARRLIPLRDVIAGTGPDIGAHVNTYYLQFWSLTHFLFHHDGGRYAAGYHALIRQGGSVEDFERHIGPVERIQTEWYAHLRGLIRTTHTPAPSRGNIPASRP